MSGSDHFEGKEAIKHVVERQGAGIASMAESHGLEIPGHASAAACAARDTALILLCISTILASFAIPEAIIFKVVLIFGGAWVLWRFARSAWIGWSRLERLHRLMEEERYEIQHHRSQEREELCELYRAKGFEGQLLQDVIDVLMSDNDRLLRVMLEEELGLRLGVQEHPLKQAFGGGLGALAALLTIALAFPLTFPWGIAAGAFTVMGISAGYAAAYEKNRILPAVVWNVGMGAAVYGVIVFLLDATVTG